ncbi:hypothetical protein [Bacillus wiedmannii]|uniref:hypothetical protein n=1 Tax=Bacillus wiedmannii TaxID=1890302 RepID=UPI000BFBF47B|nr:hypothetical protein [Bacillus wiedmannii]PHE70493.1 hypothetical protein COF77_25095 [Bacillus wiedmannii]
MNNCSPGIDLFYVQVCTDATVYGARATSIDCEVGASYDIAGLYVFDYTVYLQEWRPDMGIWMTVDKKNGWFKNRAFPSFSLAGRRAGDYRVTADFQNKTTMDKLTKRAPAVVVKR